MSQEAIELTLQEATTDGIAYFVDNSDREYFRPRNKEPIRPLIHGHDNHPMMYQFSHRHPLAEIGRKFASLEEAEHYVGALTDFDRMLRLADIVVDTDSKTFGFEAKREFNTIQQGIKREHLDVLNTISGFGKVIKYLDMAPWEIVDELKTQGTPRDATV